MTGTVWEWKDAMGESWSQRCTEDLGKVASSSFTLGKEADHMILELGVLGQARKYPQDGTPLWFPVTHLQASFIIGVL